MITSYEVGAVLRVVDEASGVIQRIAGESQRLEAVLKQVRDALGTIRLPPGVIAGLGRMNDALVAIGGSADKGASGAVAALANIDKSIGFTQERVAALKGEMATLRLPAGAPAALVARGTGGGGGYGGGGARGGGPLIRGAGIPIPGGATIEPSHGGGLWEFIGGAAALDVVKNILSAGGELETQKKLLHDLLGANEKPGDVDKALGLSVKWSSDAGKGIIGTTPSQILAGIRELIPFTHDIDAAEQAYLGAMRGAKVLEELTGGKRKAADEVQGLVKALEQVGGGIDPATHQLSAERLQATILEEIKTIVAAGGTIDANALLGFAKQAGGMGRLTTDMPTLFDNVMTAMIDMGGNRTGTALSALGRQFLGDKMTMSTAVELEKLGIMPEGGWAKAGVGISMKPGFQMKGAEEIMDPARGIGPWLQDVWGPAVKATLEKEGHYDTAHIMAESYKDFGQQTGQRLGLLFLQNLPQLQRDQLLRHGVDPQSAYANIGDEDYAQNLNNVASAFRGFEEVLGGPSIGAAIDGLHLLTGALNALKQAAAISPGVDKAVIEAAGGGGVLAVAGAISKWLGGPGLGSITKWLSGCFETNASFLAKVAPSLVGALTGFAGLATLTSPEEQQTLDAMIAREKAAADAAGALAAAAAGAAAALRNAPSLFVPPMHPSGLGPQSPLYPTQKLEHKAELAVPIHTKIAIYLDGRVLGEAMSSELARLTTFPRQAAYGDPYLGWNAPDYNSLTG